MSLWTRITNRKKNAVLVDYSQVAGLVPEARLPFANVIFVNICDLLTDLCNDVTLQRVCGSVVTFVGFRAFYNESAKLVLGRLFDSGFCVIGNRGGAFWVMKPAEYSVNGDIDSTFIRSHDPSVSVYVMKSDTFTRFGVSDRQLLRPFLEFLDNVLNASNTVSARMGSFVICSPVQPQGGTGLVLPKAQKDALEKEISESYGALKKQKGFMLLQNPVNTQIVNLAGLDQKTQEKARLAILAICDRIKVPANQVGIIDASSSKSFANGSELREGDFSKYQSFERLLNSTFIQMAKAFGLSLDYEIYNKPTREQ